LPTDIQSEAIPLILGGGDVLMAAETGSGKTGAFCLPVLQIVWETLHLSSVKPPRTVSFDDQVVLSFSDRHPGAVLSNDHLGCQSKGENFWAGVRANKGVRKDISSPGNLNCFYFEVHFSDPGLARVGWSFANASLDLGTDAFGFGYGATAKKSNNRRFDDYGLQFGDRNDVIGCALNLDQGQISFYKNGKDLGVAFTLAKSLVDCETFFPTVCTKNARCFLRFFGDSRVKPREYAWIGDLIKSKQVTINPNGPSAAKNSTTATGPMAVIVEPSRELAEQTFKCVTDFAKHLPGQIRVALLVGGCDAAIQTEQCKNGTNIVVATPGRLEDFVTKAILSLNNCRFLIMDELDALLQQNHTNLLTGLHSRIPKMFDDGSRLQMIVCSATLHNFNVKRQAEKLMYFPTWVDLKVNLIFKQKWVIELIFFVNL
jgi:ATP-dependent RNA helicase DDX1